MKGVLFMFKLKSFILSALLVLAFSSTVLASASWWDAKDVKKNSDGTVEYSIQLNNFMNKNNGDVFNGLAVSKFGKYNRFYYYKGAKEISIWKDSFGSSVVALKGTINGKDISKIPLTQATDVKYIAHNEKCEYATITENKKKELGTYDRIKKKKGIEIAANCGCPIITQKEERPVLTPENEPIWNMLNVMTNDSQLYVSRIKLSEIKEEYWSPNMFNGTYMFNGREYTLDLYRKSTDITTVSIYPVESIYDNSAIFEIYRSKAGSFRQYKVYKEGSTYKVQECSGSVNKLLNPSKYDTIHHIPPTEELVEHAEAISRLLGISIKH